MENHKIYHTILYYVYLRKRVLDTMWRCGVDIDRSERNRCYCGQVHSLLRGNTYKTTCLARRWLGDRVDTERAISQYIKVVDISGYIVYVCTSIILPSRSFVSILGIVVGSYAMTEVGSTGYLIPCTPRFYTIVKTLCDRNHSP